MITTTTTTVTNDEDKNKEITTTVVKKKAGRPKGSVKKTGFKTAKAVLTPFLDLCSKGYSLTQISAELDVPKDTLIAWSTSKGKNEQSFVKAFRQGQTLWQAYHENLLQKMISGEDGKKYASAEISAQQFILKTQFKDSWTEKQDPTKIEINNVSRLSDEQLEQQILHLLSKSNIKNYLSNSVENADNKLKLVVNNKDDN